MKFLLLLAVVYIGYRFFDIKQKLEEKKKEQLNQNQEPDSGYTDYEEIEDDEV